MTRDDLAIGMWLAVFLLAAVPWRSPFRLTGDRGPYAVSVAFFVAYAWALWAVLTYLRQAIMPTGAGW